MTSSSVRGAYTAVLYAAPSLNVDKLNDDSANLSEPLLPSSSQPRPVQVTSDLLKRLKVLSFITGIFVAIISQYLLSQTFWQDTIMSESSRQVVVFSLGWSCLTCLMVFSSMCLYIYVVAHVTFRSSDSSLSKEASREWQDAVFQMEAHLIIGALLTISGIWVVIDIFRANPNTLGAPGVVGSIVTVTVALVLYLFLSKCLLHTHSRGAEENRNANHANSLQNTYQLIASTLGLLTGLCSQFLLSFCLWKNQMSEPLMDNVIMFSLLWSFSTVVVTFLGCLSLRLLTVDECKSEKTFLRMESHYVFFSLIGICIAWVLIDIVLDMKEQIFPSLLMLAMSLACFGVILYCFPEDKCLASLHEELDGVPEANVIVTNTKGDETTIMVV